MLLHNDTFNNKYCFVVATYCFVVATCVRVLLQIVAVVRARKSFLESPGAAPPVSPKYVTDRLTTERLTTDV